MDNNSNICYKLTNTTYTPNDYSFFNHRVCVGFKDYTDSDKFMLFVGWTNSSQLVQLNGISYVAKFLGGIQTIGTTWSSNFR